MRLLQYIRNRLAAPVPHRRRVVAWAAPEHADDPARALGNPLRSLTPESAASLLEGAMRGEWTRAQWLMYYVEQWDADVWTLVERRTGGLRQLSWTVRIDAKAAEKLGEERLAERQREFLHASYASIDNLGEAVEFLALAKFRGYAHLAVSPTHLEPLDQWWWVRSGMYGPWYWNPEAKITNCKALGEPVDPSQYIIRVERRCLIWLAILKFLRANYNQKWWDKFAEIASKQGTVIIGPPDLSPDQADAFELQARRIAAGGSGVLEHGSSVEHTGPQSQGGGETVWEKRLRYLKEDLILAGTGGMLTALSQATGIGGSQGQEQGKVWRSLLRADARDIGEVFQAQFDRRLLAAEFPGEPILARFELDAAEEPSVDAVLAHAKTAHEAGLAIDPDQLEEMTGYRLAPVASGVAADRAVLRNRARSADPAPERDPAAEVAAEIADRLGVPESWVAPIEDFIAEILSKAQDETLADADFARFLEHASAAVPEVFGAMDVDALTDLFERAMGAAAFEGARAGARLYAESRRPRS